MTKTSPQRVSPVDVRLRVIAATLGPTLSLARAMALPLDDLLEIVATGYFREARARGWSMRATARKLGKSLRSITTLSQRTKQGPDLLGKSEAIGRRRKAIAWSGAHPGATRGELARAIGGDAPEETVDQLIEEGLLELDPEGRIAVATAYVDMVKDDAAHRVDSLRHFFDAIGAAVHRRFFVHPPGGAYARVITFSAPRADVERIWAEAFERLHAAAIEADGRADGDPDAVQISVALSLADVTEPRPRPSEPG